MDCKSPLDVRNMSQCQAQIESVAIGIHFFEIVYHTPHTPDKKKPFRVEKMRSRDSSIQTLRENGSFIEERIV